MTTPTSLQDAANRSVSRRPLRVLIVAVPPMRTLDVFGPSEVFGDANLLSIPNLTGWHNIVGDFSLFYLERRIRSGTLY